jgi:hypothetical protein
MADTIVSITVMPNVEPVIMTVESTHPPINISVHADAADYTLYITDEILRGPTGPAGFIQSATAPTDTSVLWVDSSDIGSLLLKAYILGDWRIISSGGAIIDATYFFFVDENDDYWVDENDDYFSLGVQ